MADTRLESLAKTDRNPGEEAEYQSLLTASGIPFSISNGRASVTGFGTGGNESQTSDFQYAMGLSQQKQFYDEANKPVIESLQASIPEIEQKFGVERERLTGEQSALESRYAALLDEVTRIGNKEYTAAQTGASRELGRRGISLKGGIADEYIGEKTRPVSEWQSSETRQLGADRESALNQIQGLIAGLTPQMVEAQRNVQNVIAQIQSGSIKDAASAAMALWQAKQQLAEAEKDRNQQLEIAKMSNQGSEQSIADQLIRLSEGQTLFDPYSNQVLYTAPKTYKSESDGVGSGGVTDLEDLWSQYMGK